MIKVNRKNKLVLLGTVVGVSVVGTLGFSLIDKHKMNDVSSFYAALEKESIVNFSFDGEKAGILYLKSDESKKWSYSLDGGETWTEAVLNEVILSEVELASITDEKDILVRVAGETEVYKVDITRGSTPTNLYVNDRENKVLGDTRSYEWKLEGEDKWTRFAVANPDLRGNKTLKVRSYRTGTVLEGSASVYSFTVDSTEASKSYVPISNILSVDSINKDGIKKVIDGIPSTVWTVDANDAILTFKLNQRLALSQLVCNANGQSFIIEVSDDAVVWKEIKRLENLEDVLGEKTIFFDEATEATYVRLKITSETGRVNVSEVEFYHDRRKSVHPVVDVDYNVRSLTNGDVVASIIMDDGITITNNDSKTERVFTQNGDYTFEFVDTDGKSGSITAHVDWIDKKAPVGIVKYSTTELTNKEVVAEVRFDEEVTILSNVDGLSKNADGSYSLVFKDNKSLSFEVIDKAGNRGQVTLDVKWIDTKVPGARVEFKSVGDFGPVTAKLVLDEEGVVLNNDGKFEYIFEDNGEFVFEYRDLAGNVGSIVAKVDWIKPHAKVGIEYSTREVTTGDVTAKIVADKIITVTNNGGNPSFIFTENGEFTFTYVDEYGNNGSIVARVDWIDKKVVENVPNKPSTPNNKPVSKPTTKPSTSNKKDEEDTTSSGIQYKNYSVGSIGLKVPSESITQTVNLYSRNLSLDDVKGSFSSESEFIELFLENEKNEVYNLKSKNVTLRFKLDNSKEFKGIYLVDDVGNATKLDYGNESDNNISVKTNGLGKFLLSYESRAKEEATPVPKETVKSYNILWIVGAVLVVLIVLVGIIMIRKKRASREEETDFYKEDQF
ncbi:MAG TPA: hypothetical protein DCY94_04435 [Firmicutes bacterium]|nr:hypothetical protein [Bacillota bacterium]